MERIVAAGVVVTDDLGRVLLVLRGREPQKGRWSIPGGSAEPGESPAQAAVREAREETGLVIDLGRELWVVDIPTDDGLVYEVHDFAARVVGGSLRAGDDAADAQWFRGDEVDSVPLTHDLRKYLVQAGVVAD